MGAKMLTVRKKHNTAYQLISSPAVFLKSEDEALNTVYSILMIEESEGAVNGTVFYDVARSKVKGERILSEVERRAPSKGEISDLISELL